MLYLFTNIFSQLISFSLNWTLSLTVVRDQRRKNGQQKIVQVYRHILQFDLPIGVPVSSTEISNTYFKFPTVSSLEFICPGKETAKGMNICFHHAQLMDMDKFLDILQEKYRGDKTFSRSHPILKKMFYKADVVKKYFSIGERFNMSLDLKFELTSRLKYRTFFTRYILGTLICYHITPEVKNKRFNRNSEVEVLNDEIITDEIFNVTLYHRSIFDNVTYMYITMSAPYQLASQEFLTVGLSLYNVSVPRRYMISSHSYRFSKLQWPYV